MPSGRCAAATSPNPVIWRSCLRVLSLVYHAGHGRPNDLASEAIRLTRQLTLATTEPEARGLLALMLLQHARLPARTDSAGRFVPLDEQDRSLWDTAEIAEGVAILQGALGRATPGPLPDPGGDRCPPCRRHRQRRRPTGADPRVVRRAHRPERRTRSRRSCRGPQPGGRRRTRRRCRGGARRDRAGGRGAG